MTWYAAHLVFYVKLKHKRQTRYPAWENVVLISAKTEDEAFEKAERRALEDACMEPDETFTWSGQPAEWVFAGIRKLTRCRDEDQRPKSGTEVTYLELELPSKQALERFVAGEQVTLRVEDSGRDDDLDEFSSIPRRKAE